MKLCLFVSIVVVAACLLIMPKGRPTTRMEQCREQRTNYLAGKASQPYRHTPTLRRPLDESEAGSVASDRGSSSASSPDRVCCKCKPVLLRYHDPFTALVHQGSTRKRRKSRNPYPKRTVMQHYRDMNAQNEWIRENIFDTMGNYLFCARCVCAALKVSPQRLARLRTVKRAQSQSPTIEMTKQCVEQDRLAEYVVMPIGSEQSFKDWWRSLDESATVVVRYPHQRHGNAGKQSNSAKTSTMNDFLSFVDSNCQPNGRTAESHGPTYYFISKFTTIQMPKKGVSTYTERVQRSVVGEFNRIQKELGKDGCSNGSAFNWLHKHRAKVAICPQKQDYCNTCAVFNKDVHAKQTTLNRIRQTGSATEECQKDLEEEIAGLKTAHETHRQESQLSHADYIKLNKRCKEEMTKIKTLEQNTDPSEEEMEELARMRNKFTLTVSVDYQMSKLLPNWGYSPQPGSTYYLQKLSHDLLGIVNHSNDQAAMYIFDERIGPKTTDHTVSYFTDYLCDSGKVPSWVRRLHVYMDNAGSINKNQYFMGWASEMVQQGRFDFIRVSFLIAGHTKFSPDLLFSKVSHTFSRSDTFTTAELAEIARQYAYVVIDEGDKVFQWRQSLVKYSALPGIRSLHDFLFVRHPGSDVKLRVRRLCYSGSIHECEFHVKRGYTLAESAIPTGSMSYRSTGQVRPISDTKLAHLRQMFTNFIPQERHPSFL